MNIKELIASTRTCRIRAFSPKVKNLFTIPDHLSLELIIALGAPAEHIVIDDMKDADDIKYWRDANQVHHVPKRSLEDVLLHLQRTESGS